MALDPAVESVLSGEMLAGSRESARLTSVVDRNLVQGFGTILEVLVQQHGGVADDAAVMAALRTTMHIPERDKSA